MKKRAKEREIFSRSPEGVSEHAQTFVRYCAVALVRSELNTAKERERDTESAIERECVCVCVLELHERESLEIAR